MRITSILIPWSMKAQLGFCVNVCCACNLTDQQGIKLNSKENTIYFCTKTQYRAAMPIYHAVKYYTCVLVSCSMHQIGESTGEHVHRQNFDPTICSYSAWTPAYLTSTDLLWLQLQPSDTEVVEGCTVRKYCKLTFTTRILPFVFFFFKKNCWQNVLYWNSPQTCRLKHPEMCTPCMNCVLDSVISLPQK